MISTRFIGFTIVLSILPYYLIADILSVHNKNKKPLEFVYILNTTNKYWSISDHNGIAPIPKNTKLNDTLKIQRYGYNSVLKIYKNKEIFIILEDLLINLPLIHVTGSDSNNISNFHKINVKKKTGYESISHKEYLERLPGVQLRSLGGPVSITTISLNGGPTSQTKVQLNGFDLTNMQTGVTDLSQIPNAFINKARISPTGSDLLSSGSQNGILELSLWNPINSFSLSKGSFNKTASHIQHSWSTKLLKTSIIIGSQKDPGEYKVSWRGKSFKRKNNNFDQLYGSLQFNGIIKPNLFFKGFSLITKQNRGVPGQVWSPLEASHIDNLNIFGSNLNWISKIGQGSLKYIYRMSKDIYINPVYNIKSQNCLKSSSLIFSNPILKTKKFVMRFSSKIQNQFLSSENKTYEKSFLTGTLDLHYSLTKNISILPSLQNNYSKKFFNNMTYSLVSNFDFDNQIIKQISYSYSSHFRHPTFNDLYWNPGGNASLEPETGKNNSLSIAMNPTSFGVVDFIFFNSKTNNLIQWLPVQSYWQAKNINNVKRYGTTGNLSFNTSSFNSSISLTFVKSSFGDDNRLLRYSPENIATIYLEKITKDWMFSANIHYTDFMISMYSYPKDNMIPPSSITSFNTSKTYSLKNIELIGMASLLNAFDTQYETSKGYPEPGRSIRITLTLNQKRKY